MNMTETKKKSRWGIGIAVVYGVFMLAVIAVVIASRFQQADLVSHDYYDKEIKYQDQIDKVKRTQAGGYQLAIELAKGSDALQLRFPEGLASGKISGNLKLFRPSNASLDRNFVLASENAAPQEIACGKLARGLWKIQVDWQLDTLQYYHEQELFVE
jgi:hypothetical protein